MSLLHRVAVSAGTLVVALSAISLSAQMPGDHLTGTWILAVGQSKYSPADLAPKAGRTRITVNAEGIKVTTDGKNSKGEDTHSEYTAKFDEKDYPWKGTVAGKPDTDQDAVSWKRSMSGRTTLRTSSRARSRPSAISSSAKMGNHGRTP